MKLRDISIAATLIALMGMVGSCKKEFPNRFNMFNVKVSFNTGKPNGVDADGKIEINDRDSVVIDYTIESPDKDMYQVLLFRNGATNASQKTIISDISQRRRFSGQFKLYAKDLGAGTSTFRIWPIDKEGVYMGDDDKTVTIQVNTDMLFFDNRRLYIPDSATGKNNCYLSLADATTYNYLNGAAHAAKIDVALYTKWELISNKNTRTYYLYSLSADPLPFTPYDISSWAKRETLFSAPVATNATTFYTATNTGAKIEDAAKLQTINQKAVTKRIEAANMVYFKTPEGKYGVIYFVGEQTDSDEQVYMAIIIKRQP